MIELHCVVKGKVQGVGFRAYVENAADELKLMGWVKNRGNGEVEVVVQGTPDTLKEFIEYLHEGSLLSSVEGVEVEWRDSSVTYSDFSVLH